MLIHRILTAIILIPITLALLFYLPPAGFCLLTGIIILAGAWEWSALTGLQSIAARSYYLAATAALLMATLFIPAQIIFIVAFIWWLIAAVLVRIYPRGSHCWSQRLLWRALMGWLVLVPCWAAINFARNQSDGIYVILFLFILIWGADSAAYFVGKRWGVTKLAPEVSPGKSVQGFVGALVFSAAITIVALWCSQTPVMVWPFGLGLALITVVFSVVGDLLESMLKRQAGLKDSGQLLPGHGGLLDRIDSLTAAAPIFVLGAMMGDYLY